MFKKSLIAICLLLFVFGCYYMTKPKPKVIIQPPVQTTVIEEPIIEKSIVEEYLISMDIPLDMTDLYAIAWVESRLNPMTVGDSGELGILQIMPATWDYTYNWIVKYRPDIAPLILDWRDVKSNTLVSISFFRIIADELKANGQIPDKAMLITAYNMGVPQTLAYYRKGRCLPTYTISCLKKSDEFRQNKTPNKLLMMIK